MMVGAFEFISCPPKGWAVDWERSWETGLTASGQGQEDREAKRAVGLKAITFTTQPLDIVERQGLLASIGAALVSGKACAPYWGRSSVLAADCSGTTVTLEDNVWGWAITDFVFLFDQDLRQWEVRSVSNVVGNVLTLSGGAVARTYKAGTLCWPLIFGLLQCESADVLTNHRAEPKITIREREVGFSKVESNCPVLTTYLGRPVAPLENLDGPNTYVDAEQTQSFAYDLRELLKGFGAPGYRPLANNVVNGFELKAILDGAAAIKAWDCLTAGLPGRAAGFWLADPLCVFDVVSSPAANVVRVTDSDFAAVWAADPAVYVVFRKEGAADKFAKITAAADVGGGLEEITLDANVSVDASWLAYRLRYVRLASDTEKGSFEVENRMVRMVRVVELPEEYAAVETGLAPIWFYTFWINTPGGPTYWRLTSYAEGKNSNGHLFASENLTHGAIKRSTEAAEECEVQGERLDGNIFGLFPDLSLPLWVQIEEATVGAPDATEVLFVGIAQKGPMSGRDAKIKFSSFLDALGQDVPGFILQPRCNYRVFGPGCNLVAATYEKAVLIAAISADRLVIDLKGAAGAITGNNVNGFDIASDNYFALGWLEFGAGSTYQLTTTLKSVHVNVSIGGGPVNVGVRVWLSRPLQAAAVVGSAATLRPGCDGSIDACNLKYGNWPNNYGGHPFIPTKNPSLPPLTSGTASGAKK
jgi:hypothetical protein